MVPPLPPEVLHWRVPEEALPFDHTGEIAPIAALVGQEDALEALKLGLHISHEGYNVFATGLSGGGRLRTLGRVLESLAPKRRKSRDFLYVQNLLDPARPRLLVVPSGTGARLQQDLAALLSHLFVDIPTILAQIKAQPPTGAELLEEVTAVVNGVAPLFEAVAQRHRPARKWIFSLLEALPGHLDAFREGPEAAAKRIAENGADAWFLAFAVHVFHRGSKSRKAPVVLVPDPTFRNLFGGVEQDGSGSAPCHLHLRAGAVHDADGGYLVIDATDLLADAECWKTLQRALRFGEIGVRNPEAGMAVGPTPLLPDLVPLDVKVILLGHPAVYNALYYGEPDFEALFKCKVEFSETVPYSPALPMQIAGVLARLGRRERWRPLHREAIARLIAWAGRESGRGGRIRLNFGPLADLAREANALCKEPIVRAEDIDRALAARARARGQAQRRLHEALEKDLIHVRLEGAVVGQVNGLAVMRAGGQAFGRPLRVTATCGTGRGGVLDIDREVGLSGKSHTKGTQVITGFLRGLFSRDRTLALTATLCFEQSYNIIDGDSASVAELTALLSAISGVPALQDRAVTGSVDQLGRIQPIGSVNDKIEGYFDLCVSRGLTGTQGVIVPALNVADLALDRRVIEAVAAGTFHVWAVSRVEEALELLTGIEVGDPEARSWPAETLYGRVCAALDDLERVTRQASKGPEKPAKATNKSADADWGGPSEGPRQP